MIEDKIVSVMSGLAAAFGTIAVISFVLGAIDAPITLFPVVLGLGAAVGVGVGLYVYSVICGD